MSNGNLNLTAIFDIEKEFSHEETARKIGDALGLKFELDDSGRWEEYPAYVSFCLGVEFALLAPPEPEYDLREEPTDTFQLTTRDHTKYREGASKVDLSVYLASIIQDKAGLKCEQIQ